MLEPGETAAIVNAVQTAYDPLIEQMEQRVHAVELRVANVETRVKGGVQLGTEEVQSTEQQFIYESLSTHDRQIQQLAAVYEQMRVMVETHGVAIMRVLTGGSDDAGWRAFVVGEMVRLGVGVGEYAGVVRAQKAADGQEELPLDGAGEGL